MKTIDDALGSEGLLLPAYVLDIHDTAPMGSAEMHLKFHHFFTRPNYFELDTDGDMGG